MSRDITITMTNLKNRTCKISEQEFRKDHAFIEDRSFKLDREGDDDPYRSMYFSALQWYQVEKSRIL